MGLIKDKLTVAEFRKQFPNFTADEYKDDRIEFYIDMADTQLIPHRWGTMLLKAAGYYIAHYVAIEKYIEDAGPDGAFELARGPQTASTETVGPLTESGTYGGTGTYALPNQGQYGLTWYGQRFKQLQRIYGGGGIQL